MTTRLRVLLLAVPLAAGCQQQMAEQAYHRPYEKSNFFAKDGYRSNRPLEFGVVARGQFLDDNPLMTGLSEQGRRMASENTAKKDAGKQPPIKKDAGAKDEPARPETGKKEEAGKDPPGKVAGPADRLPDQEPTPSGVPAVPENYVNAFPFPIQNDDLVRGQERYQIFCLPCHGPLGDGNGKIKERGYLNPTSYHTTLGDNPKEDLPRGYSRGFNRWGQKIALEKVPVGYIYEVIARGYGGMPEHGSMVTPADRWRIVAYVRALQLSQNASAKDLPAESRAALEGKQ